MRFSAVFISIQSADAKRTAEPAVRLKDLGIEPEIFAINADDADDDILAYQDLVRHTKQADFIFIRCMADTNRFKRYEKYEKVLQECNAYTLVYSGNAEITMLRRHLFKGDDDQYAKLIRYAASRGPENDYGMMHCICKILGFTDVDPPEPIEQRRDGYYYKGLDRDITPEEFRKTLDKDKLSVGIIFASSLWIYDNLAAIDALTEEIERRGMNALPVFFSSTSYKHDNDEGTREVIERYFTQNGKPIIDVLIVHTQFSIMYNSRKEMGVRIQDVDNYLSSMLDIPILNTLTVTGDYFDYEKDKIGLNKHAIANNVAFPEIDGDIITVPISYTPTKSGMKKNIPIQDRIESVVEAAYRWGRLKHIPNSEKRVAILFWQHRPNSGVIGNAAGLDGIESISDLLQKMSSKGYVIDNVPSCGMELIDELLDNVTNDLDAVSLKTMREKAEGLVPAKEYIKDYESSVPEWDRTMIENSWGPAPGELMIDSGKLIIPGLRKGNIFIGYQPIRGLAENMEKGIHDPDLFSQHQYLAYYRWLRDVFKADMIIHVGTHGTVEWLPGKNVGMSEKCNPDVVLKSMPNLYIYIIDDPGEGTQCKRRSESVLIGHMPPTMGRAGSYEEIAEVEIPLQEYITRRNTKDAERKKELIQKVYDAAKEHDMFSDLKIPDDTQPEDFERYIIPLHEYISELKDALVRTDLHVLGRVPAGNHLEEMIYSLTRLDNGNIKSLRDALAINEGFNLQELISNPAGETNGELNSSIIDRIDSEVSELISFAISSKFDADACISHIKEKHGKITDELSESIRYMCDSVAPNVLRMSDEVENLLHGLDGGYVLPGPSGAPTRGNADILPMGRNFYSLDPNTVPSRVSWEIGKKMADQMIERYVSEKGEYPREVGFVIWATDTMKTGGDDMAYILWLLGVRPVWSSTGGQVIDLEILPLSELGRPRIDVTVNITGLFRDTFPNLIDMIDDAVKMVADLDEDAADNALAANLRKDIVEGIAKGLTPDEARRRNSVRIFGAPPGGYGTGVNKAIETGAWKTVQDLADVYMDWCSHGYTKGNYGEKMKDEFIHRFSQVGVTVKNMPDREYDLLDVDDVYSYLGGMNAFVRAYGKKDAISMMGDGSDPKKTKLRGTQEELRYAFRTKVLNPKFINGLKEHGYRGAAEMVNLTEYTMAWGATSDIAEDWMYEGLTDKFLLDEDTKEWMKDVNPYAMMNILSRLEEAIDRGLWNASEEYRQKIKDLFLETEERIEELTDR